MNRCFGFCILLLVIGICLCFPSFPFPDQPKHSASGHGEASRTHNCRKLKEDINADHIDLLDYHRIDPVPSSKASIRPGPIEHGTPLMPYIPKPAPPGPIKPP